MKKPSLYPIFFGLITLFTAQFANAAHPRCCTTMCGSSEPYGCCPIDVRPQCEDPEPKPSSTATPSATPVGPKGGDMNDYSIVQENGVYKAIRK